MAEAVPLIKEDFLADQDKKAPKPFCGLRAIGLQATRKPNSVLDDHSSTRRITAAL
jgi:hypothetical protein